jgi:hypothetical protein
MQNSVQEKPASRNRTIIIVVVIIIALCGCLIAAVAGFYAFIAIRSEESSPTQPTVESYEFVPPPVIGIGSPPDGGLGNDILKNNTWEILVPVAVGNGCEDPSGSLSTIEVLQQPENGVWYEQWTVMCSTGEAYAFEIEFILDDTGATFNITPLP